MFIINELPHPNRGKNKFRDIFENDRKDWKKALKGLCCINILQDTDF